jgi:hypothetical protein
VRKIALILGGGPGGGAYAAGAVAELLTALEASGAPTGPTLDVIVGASAAALPAAVAARALVVNPALVPWIERAWVEALDARVLLDPGRRDPSGLLASEPLRELAETLVAGDPAADDRPSGSFGGALQLGFPLNPVRPVGAPIRSALFELRSEHRAGDPVWRLVAAAALAGHATPGLLPPVRLKGQGGSILACDGESCGESAPALGLALAERVPDATASQWDTFVVEPRLFATPAPDGDADSGGESRGPLEGLVAALRGADPAAAWHREALRRDRLSALEELSEQLGDLSGDLDDPRALATGRRIGALAERVADRHVARGERAEGGGADPGLAVLDRGLERIQADPRYGPAFGGIETRAGRTRLAKLIFILEEATGLGGQVAGRLHAVAPPPDRPLAGPALGGLAGPLCRAWRLHDFQAGQRDMRRVLRGALPDLLLEGDAGREDPDPRPIRPGLDTLPDADRRRLDSFLEGEADRWLRSIRPGGMAGALFGMARAGASRRAAARLRETLAGLRI